MRELKVAARRLWRRRSTSSLTLAVLALGIGLATAMWSLIDGVLVRGLPFPDGRRIVMFSTLRGAEWPMPAADFLARDLESLLFRDGARCLVPGILLGAALAACANPFLRGLLYQVATWDPAVTGASVAAVALAAAAAVYRPARAAAVTDPARVLHSE